MLFNEVLTKGGVHRNETFRGKTEIRYTLEPGGVPLVFKGCTFVNDSTEAAQYALFVDAFLDHRPRARFEDCEIRGGKKAAVVQYCGFFGCDFSHAEDGIFASAIHPDQGRILLQSCKVHDLGLSEHDHADCFQATAGGWYRIIDSVLDARPSGVVWPNSAVMIQTRYGPISNVIIANNRGLFGGGHLLQFWNDTRSGKNYGPPRGVRVTDNYHAGGWAFSPLVFNERPVGFVEERNAWQREEVAQEGASGDAQP